MCRFNVRIVVIKMKERDTETLTNQELKSKIVQNIILLIVVVILIVVSAFMAFTGFAEYSWYVYGGEGFLVLGIFSTILLFVLFFLLVRYIIPSRKEIRNEKKRRRKSGSQ